MNQDEVLRLYDEKYARSYDGRFLQGGPWKDVLAEYMVEVIRELLHSGDCWLDVSCGIGWHLSQFPSVTRAGLDLSPGMLAIAAERNPDVRLFEGSYRDNRPAWDNQWDLVTNLWFAYQYVESMREVDDVLARLASWVSPSGTLLVHVGDSEDLPPWKAMSWETPLLSGSLYLTGLVWSWKEANGTRHDDLVAPHLQRMVNMTARHFEQIEVRRWPVHSEGPRHKAIICRRKRPSPLSSCEVGDTYPYAEVYARARHLADVAPDVRRTLRSDSGVRSAATTELLRELGRRVRNGRLLTAASRHIWQALSHRQSPDHP